jgi:hypothetical protein
VFSARFGGHCSDFGIVIPRGCKTLFTVPKLRRYLHAVGMANGKEWTAAPSPIISTTH